MREEIEKLPASDQQTKVSILASDLKNILSKQPSKVIGSEIILNENNEPDAYVVNGIRFVREDSIPHTALDERLDSIPSLAFIYAIICNKSTSHNLRTIIDFTKFDELAQSIHLYVLTLWNERFSPRVTVCDCCKCDLSNFRLCPNCMPKMNVPELEEMFYKLLEYTKTRHHPYCHDYVKDEKKCSICNLIKEATAIRKLNN